MCGRYTATSGAGAYWASSPAASGPSPNPAVIATVARRGTRSASPGLPALSSPSQDVPQLNAAPLATPAISRPAYSTTVVQAPTASTTLAATDSANAQSMMCRRPRRSDSGPPSSSPGTRPTA